jgi:hypothetical protein
MHLTGWKPVPPSELMVNYSGGTVLGVELFPADTDRTPIR